MRIVLQTHFEGGSQFYGNISPSRFSWNLFWFLEPLWSPLLAFLKIFCALLSQFHLKIDIQSNVSSFFRSHKSILAFLRFWCSYFVHFSSVVSSLYIIGTNENNEFPHFLNETKSKTWGNLKLRVVKFPIWITIRMYRRVVINDWVTGAYLISWDRRIVGG